MSEFNTRKDRLPDGKAKPHYRLDFRAKQGVKTEHHPASDKPNPDLNWAAAKSPGWWNNLYSTCPRRVDDRRNIHAIMRGGDADGMVWHDNKKPVSYHW
ncbi:hypothetical protein ID007_004325 [Salmonella enterica]|nr:hypothetical protein [Salmonella enterica]